ncbi:hypothetical protein D9M68_288690 [compost metagenome]
MSDIVYFSKMFQAVPHLAQVAKTLSGVFVTSRKSTLRAVGQLYPSVQTARYSKYLGLLARGNRLCRSAKVIVTGSPYRSFLAPYPAKKCTVFHGTYMMLSREALVRNAHFDLLCVIGPRMQGMIERFDMDRPLNTVQTGFLPFCEFPERSPMQRVEALVEMGLDPQRKTVLYTPSRRGQGSWEYAAMSLLRTTPPDYNLVLRPHPSQSLTPRGKDRESFRQIGAAALRRKNTLLDLTSKPLPVLQSVADLIVSDANSPAEESLFYDVPQLFLETDRFSQRIMRDMVVSEGMHALDVERLMTLYDCGARLRVTGDADFSTVLDHCIADSGRFAGHRQDYFSWVFGSRDRLAGERVAAAIRDQLLHND